ncbi:MAG: potassium channel family protein [Intestinibacter sp.]|uniref:potassium channel family protein n=1 Tax=Intestinibacter sp. TaxID=1965304 RepID=UPI003F149A43
MKSVLVIGLGRFGKHMSQKLIEEGNEVFAIEKNEEIADSSIDIIDNIQIGDARNEVFLKSIGVGNFDICVIAIGDDFQSTLEITVLLKDLGAKFIIARASKDVHKKLLLRNGADYVVYAERDMAEKLAIKFGAKNIFDYIELNEEYGIYEIAVPSSWKGKSIIEQSIRNKYNISILAIKKYGKIYPMPDPNHIFSNDESLMVMGSHNVIKKITK